MASTGTLVGPAVQARWRCPSEVTHSLDIPWTFQETPETGLGLSDQNARG